MDNSQTPAERDATRDLARAMAVASFDKGKRAKRALHDSASRGRQVAAGNKRFTPGRSRQQRGR